MRTPASSSGRRSDQPHQAPPHREFLVQGVRPITRAVEQGWTVRALLRVDDAASTWGDELSGSVDADKVVLSPSCAPGSAARRTSAELVAVVEMPDDGVERLADTTRPHGPIVVFDRPTSPATSAPWPVRRMRSARVPGRHGPRGRSLRPAGGPGQHRFALRAHRPPRVPGPGRCRRFAHGHGYRGRRHRRDRGSDLARRGPHRTCGDRRRRRDRRSGLGGERVLRRPAPASRWSGSASSLNAAVAGSIVLHAALRQRG